MRLLDADSALDVQGLLQGDPGAEQARMFGGHDPYRYVLQVSAASCEASRGYFLTS